MKISLIISGDYDMQIIKILPFMSADQAISEANYMSANGELSEMKIDHYDVIHFESVNEMNEWIKEQVTEGRKILHTQL